MIEGKPPGGHFRGALMFAALVMLALVVLSYCG